MSKIQRLLLIFCGLLISIIYQNCGGVTVGNPSKINDNSNYPIIDPMPTPGPVITGTATNLESLLFSSFEPVRSSSITITKIKGCVKSVYLYDDQDITQFKTITLGKEMLFDKGGGEFLKINPLSFSPNKAIVQFSDQECNTSAISIVINGSQIVNSQGAVVATTDVYYVESAGYGNKIILNFELLIDQILSMLTNDATP